MTTTDPACPPESPSYIGMDVPDDVWGLDAATTGELTLAELDYLASFDMGMLHVPGYATKGRPIVL